MVRTEIPSKTVVERDYAKAGSMLLLAKKYGISINTLRVKMAAIGVIPKKPGAKRATPIPKRELRRLIKQHNGNISAISREVNRPWAAVKRMVNELN